MPSTKPFEASKSVVEAMMDKTTRVVREILDVETEQRQTRLSRPRKVRL